LSHLWLMK
jgi:hypothetical protein